MISFRCLPISTETANRFRTTSRDDQGNDVRIFNRPDGGYPCRHCLKESSSGEPVLLGSYNLARPRGIYWTPSPIFVHAAQCPPYAAVDHIPDIVRNRLVSLRAYDANDAVIYQLGDVVEGKLADELLVRCLADARCSYVNIHTARPGCLLCVVTRDSH